MLRALAVVSAVAFASSVLISLPADAASKSGYVPKCKAPEKWDAKEGKCAKAAPKQTPAKKAPAKKAPEKKAA